MENYDLLSLYKNTVKSTGCSCGEDHDHEDIYDDDAMYSRLVGGFEMPEYTLVTVNDNDTAQIDGKEVNSYGGALTDEDVEQGIAAQNAEEESKTKNLFDLSRFKDMGKKLVSKVKVLIYNLHNPTKPVTPTNPDEPDNPDDTDDTITPTPPTPSSDGTDGTGPKEEDKEPNSALTLSRGDSSNLTVNGTAQVITLKNPFGGKDYQYTVTSTNGSSVNATFEFLKNGRFIITGDNIKVVANNNQKDDIILMGNGCDLDTGDGDDIIRVGFVKDTKTLKMSNGQSVHQLMSNGVTYVGTANNKITSGSGNDYISMFGQGYTINAGSEADYVQLIGEISHSSVSGAEVIQDFQSKTSGVDGIDGWVLQGTEGDCRLLAFFNSLCGNQNVGKLSDYVTIQKSGLSYIVTFKNYPGAKKSISISTSDINNYTGVYGDLDTVVTDMALNRLLAQNKDRGKASVEKAYYNTLANYMLGSEKVTFISTTKDTNFQQRFVELWNKYKSEEISNFEIGIQTSNAKLGIISGHAYSVKNLVENEYVEVVNPWDDADCLRLSWNDFFNLSLEAIVYGYDVYNENWLVPNGGTLVQLTSAGDDTVITEIASQFVSAGTNATDETQLIREIRDIEDKVNHIKNLILDENKKNIELLS